MPEAPRFPILVKLLDAQEKLSLQVHPDAAAAAAGGGEPKTEMWYFAAADDGAEIYAGLRRGVEPGAILSRRFVAASGRSGAPDRGENRGRLFRPERSAPRDRRGQFARRDPAEQRHHFSSLRLGTSACATGTPRPLQVEAALQSDRPSMISNPDLIRPDGETLVQCSHFVVEKWNLKSARPRLRATCVCAFRLPHWRGGSECGSHRARRVFPYPRERGSDRAASGRGGDQRVLRDHSPGSLGISSQESDQPRYRRSPGRCRTGCGSSGWTPSIFQPSDSAVKL